MRVPGHTSGEREPLFPSKEENSDTQSDVPNAQQPPAGAMMPTAATSIPLNSFAGTEPFTARTRTSKAPGTLPLQETVGSPSGARQSIQQNLIAAEGSILEQLKTFDAIRVRSTSALKAGGAPSNRIANTADANDVPVIGDAASLDSYGIPCYHPRYPNGNGSAYGDVSVPWNLRPSVQRISCNFFNVLRQPQFWSQFEFALRIAVISVLVPGALIAARLPNSPFVSPFMVFSSTVLAAKRSSGEAVAYIFNWMRAGILWLPLSVIAGALGLGNHIAVWCIYYVLMLFIMACLTEGIVRRICLLLFNSCTVGLLMSPERGAIYPCRVMVDWCIGTGLCVVAAFFPYPLFCKREAQRTLREIGRNTGTAYRGLVYSFWSPSNVERNMAMSKVRIMTSSLDELLPLFEHHQTFSFYEFLFESAEEREIRAIKFAFFERLRINLSSMTRVLDMVEAKPSAIDDPERSRAFGELLNPHLNAVAESFDELLAYLAHANTRAALLDLRDRFENFVERTIDLQDTYKLARRVIFYEHSSDVLEEFVPLMTFYLFTVACVRDTVDIFRTKITAYQPSLRRTLKEILVKTAWAPLEENIMFVKKLVTLWNRREIQRVIEAGKVSGAMLLTIGFTYLIQVDKASFTGPNIIAFVAGANPVEAVQESIVRLTGCLLGTVLGFFAGTYSNTPVQRVASLCTLMFFGTFLRFDKEYGVMAVYGMFVLIPLDSITETTMSDTVERMNQNTFGIFIYLFVSAFVLPLSPGLILRSKRSNVLRRMSAVVSSMMELFGIPLANDVQNIATAELGEAQPLGSTEGNGNVAPPFVTPSNRSIHLLAQTDTPMVEIDKQITDVMRRLRSTKEMMKFAWDERTLVEVDYPVKTCEETYLHMYRMTMLLKTMWMSWNVMRSQRTYTIETQRMLSNLQPIARDVAGAFQRFVDLMCYMIKEPTINLEGDIMKSVLDLIEAADELHRRKSLIMLLLINKPAKEYLEKLEASEKGACGGGDSTSTTQDGAADTSPLGQGSSPCTAAATDLNRAQSHLCSPQLQQPHSPGWDSTHHVLPSLTVFAPGGGFMRSTTLDSAFQQRVPCSPVAPPGGASFSLHAISSERNISMTTYGKSGSHGVGEKCELLTGPARLPSSFQFPVTSEDAEGLHSFTLSLEMFANEVKLLMMSLGVMLDNLRTKL